MSKKRTNDGSRIIDRYDAVDNLIELIEEGMLERINYGKKSNRIIYATDSAYNRVLKYMGVDTCAGKR